MQLQLLFVIITATATTEIITDATTVTATINKATIVSYTATIITVPATIIKDIEPRLLHLYLQILQLQLQ